MAKIWVGMKTIILDYRNAEVYVLDGSYDESELKETLKNNSVEVNIDDCYYMSVIGNLKITIL